MPKKARGAGRTRHNSRNFVVRVLETPPAAAGMLTKEIEKRVASLAGKKIPPYSIYQALRTLVKRHQVSAVRKGRQFSYRLTTAKPAVRAPSTETTAPSPTPEVPVVATTSLTAVLPHKLAPGEVTILHIEESHIETATNEHGKLVLQRHPRPK
ncbi:MAG TPA: hypothetical protein VJQ43_06900 [Thermoplasmata archaeon]|nr:hypothetical protein [Thermoplasmata archaeon]